MANELCPRCGAVRNIVLSTSQRKSTEEDGKTLTVITTNYHCEACHSFVRSEESKVLDPQ